MYPSNLSDQEWSEIEHFFRRSDPRGAKSIHSKHTIVNAVLYVVKSGCQWRMLPHDFPRKRNHGPVGPLEKTLGCRAHIRLVRRIQKTIQRF